MPKDPKSFLYELHSLRAQCKENHLEESVEALRIAIIVLAQESNLPTGLSAEDLMYGLNPKPPERSN